MQPRTTTAIAVATTVLMLVSGCGAGDGDTAQIETSPVAIDDTTSESDAAAPPPSGSAEDTDDAEEASTSPDSSEGSGQRLPQDVDDLDIEVRHPAGMVVQVTGISFDQYDIFVDVTVFNRSSDELYFAEGQRKNEFRTVRLVDDAGEEYQYLPPEGQDDTIKLGPREELTAHFAFGGPLLGEPEQLRLVTNVPSLFIDRYEGEDERSGCGSPRSQAPCFVIPIDLVWD